MTVKEYLHQAYRLDHRIDSDIAEMERLRGMACSVSSPGFEEHYNPNRPTDAPFYNRKCPAAGRNAAFYGQIPQTAFPS